MPSVSVEEVQPFFGFERVQFPRARNQKKGRARSKCVDTTDIEAMFHEMDLRANEFENEFVYVKVCGLQRRVPFDQIQLHTSSRPNLSFCHKDKQASLVHHWGMFVFLRRRKVKVVVETDNSGMFEEGFLVEMPIDGVDFPIGVYPSEARAYLKATATSNSESETQNKDETETTQTVVAAAVEQNPLPSASQKSPLVVQAVPIAATRPVTGCISLPSQQQQHQVQLRMSEEAKKAARVERRQEQKRKKKEAKAERLRRHRARIKRIKKGNLAMRQLEDAEGENGDDDATASLTSATTHTGTNLVQRLHAKAAQQGYVAQNGTNEDCSQQPQQILPPLFSGVDSNDRYVNPTEQKEAAALAQFTAGVIAHQNAMAGRSGSSADGQENVHISFEHARSPNEFMPFFHVDSTGIVAEWMVTQSPNYAANRNDLLVVQHAQHHQKTLTLRKEWLAQEKACKIFFDKNPTHLKEACATALGLPPHCGRFDVNTTGIVLSKSFVDQFQILSVPEDASTHQCPLLQVLVAKQRTLMQTVEFVVMFAWNGRMGSQMVFALQQQATMGQLGFPSFLKFEMPHTDMLVTTASLAAGVKMTALQLEVCARALAEAKQDQRVESTTSAVAEDAATPFFPRQSKRKSPNGVVVVDSNSRFSRANSSEPYSPSCPNIVTHTTKIMRLGKSPNSANDSWTAATPNIHQ